MAKITFPRTDLTLEQVVSDFKDYFAQKGYTVPQVFKRRFLAKKNGWVGAIVTMRVKENETIFRMGGYSPSLWVRMFLYGLIPYLIISPKWNAFIKEIENFLKEKYGS